MTGRLAGRNDLADGPRSANTGYPVLIIDDHELFSTSLSLALRGEGFDAHTLAVAGVKDFLDRAAATSTGLVVLDLDLGWDTDGRHIDGADLVDGLRTRGWMVLIVSGSVESPAVAAAIAAGAIGVVPKTRSFGELVEAVITAAEGAPVMTEAEHWKWLRRHREYCAQEQEMSRRFLSLSPREREVLELLAEGMRAAAIAEHFVVSLPTVRSQIRSVLTKLRVGSQLRAVALFRQQAASKGHCS